jgi:hypothetical protein
MLKALLLSIAIANDDIRTLVIATLNDQTGCTHGCRRDKLKDDPSSNAARTMMGFYSCSKRGRNIEANNPCAAKTPICYGKRHYAHYT